jgi:multiple sugar transport system substrate-binding protein
LYYAGGSLFDEKTRTITADTPENRRALQWFADFSAKYGVDNLTAFRGGLGNFSSPQNPFISGKVSMEIQGVWMNSFIRTFNPKLDWGVAPFPAWSDKVRDVNLIESDVLVVPSGSPHPEEALDFIAYAVSPEGQELLHTKQMKFPMLKPDRVSKAFWAEHRNPYIRTYQKLAESPMAFTLPRMGLGQEYFDEATVVFDQVWLHQKTPAEALGDLQKRMDRSWEREVRRLRRLGLEP